LERHLYRDLRPLLVVGVAGVVGLVA
jgi:hypothetical protein